MERGGKIGMWDKNIEIQIFFQKWPLIFFPLFLWSILIGIKFVSAEKSVVIEEGKQHLAHLKMHAAAGGKSGLHFLSEAAHAQAHATSFHPPSSF